MSRLSIDTYSACLANQIVSLLIVSGWVEYRGKWDIHSMLQFARKHYITILTISDTKTMIASYERKKLWVTEEYPMMNPAF
jgi:hypothetical protein